MNTKELKNQEQILKQIEEIEKRITLLEMLWELAYVDGELDAAEDMLIRRIAGLIHVEDRDRIEAKQKVLNKINN